MMLRPANAADAHAILRVRTDAVMILCAGDYTPEQLTGWAALPVTPQWVQKRLDAGDTFIVAEDPAHGVIGFALRIGDAVRAVYVDPLHGRRGVGSALLREIERAALAAGIDRLHLDSSINAERFYQRHGYASDGRCEHDCGNGTKLQCVRMVKRLQTSAPARE